MLLGLLLLLLLSGSALTTCWTVVSLGFMGPFIIQDILGEINLLQGFRFLSDREVFCSGVNERMPSLVSGSN
jgi:hypothetical protein